MATIHSKRSIYRAQPAHSSVTTPTTRRARISIFGRQKVFRFPEVKGKVLEGAEFVSSSDYHAISFCFQDKTALDLVIDPCFTVHADYLDRKSGDRRVLKKWPLMHAVRFRSR